MMSPGCGEERGGEGVTTPAHRREFSVSFDIVAAVDLQVLIRQTHVTYMLCCHAKIFKLY
jgi:hypothetical protein